MLIRFFISALALAAAAPAFAQSGSVQDFQLPPDPESTATPQVQGPVDPDAPVPTTPRAIPTETPAPRPTAPPTSAPTIPLTLPQQPQSTPTPRNTPAARAAPRADRPASNDPGQALPPPPVDEAPAEATPTAGGLDFDPVPSPVAAAPAEIAATPEEGGSLFAWLAALVAALAAAGAGYWVLRRREESTPVPVIEPPLARQARPQPEPAATPELPPAPALQPRAVPAPEGVSLAAQPVRFSRSMMNATFAYSLVIENRSGEPWENVAIEADLVTAHNSAPIAEQLADPTAPLAPMRTLSALAPGETIEVKGDVRLPLQQVRAIRQGSAAVYVPLLRLRVTAMGKAPLARTFLVGQLPQRQGGNLQPFRLDEMPQSYSAIGMRPLD